MGRLKQQQVPLSLYDLCLAIFVSVCLMTGLFYFENLQVQSMYNCFLGMQTEGPFQVHVPDRIMDHPDGESSRTI